MANPPVKPLRLFISYARADRDEVERLAAALESAGFSVWWDADLEGGHHFSAEIARQLEAADAVVVIWSEASISSHWVLDEAMSGRDRGCLIPVRYDDTMPPLGFRQIQIIEMEDGEAEGAAAIARAAGQIAGRTLPERNAPPGRRKAARPAKDKKPLWWPFAWVAVGVMIFVLLNVMR